MHIAIINTGGTISCIGDPLAPMGATAFAEASEQLINPILQQQFPDLSIGYLTQISFPESASKTLDSTNLQPSDWCIMAQGILDNYAAYDGFVILHGTDSMDFSGAALSFLLNSFDSNGYATAVLNKPVIITGSQVPLYYQASSTQALSLNFITDAYQNLCGAVAAAQSGIAEVGVFFHNHLYRGNRVVKTNASQFDAFSSPNYPALAKYGINLTLNNAVCLPGPVHGSVSLESPTVLAGQQNQLKQIMASINSFPIIQLNAFPSPYTLSPPRAFHATLIDAVVSAGARGIILESYGEGNFPSGNPDTPSAGAIYQALIQANQSGVNLVDCTQVLAGTVNNSAYASGSWLAEVGALAPADITPMAALAKLMILMTTAAINGWTRQQVQDLMQTNLAGEMLSVNYLDSRINAELLPNQSISALDGSAILINTPDQGPLLLASGRDTSLWRLPITIQPSDLPGRLRIQDDGNLVFYNRNNQAIWASNTGQFGGASSRLVISGHYDSSATSNSLIVQIYNYSSMVSACIIYPNLTSGKEHAMNSSARPFKFSGVIAPQDFFHQATHAPGLDAEPDEHYIAPTVIPVKISVPEEKTIGVPQYSPTVYGEVASHYAPAADCEGNFMSFRFQPNNNCYAYGCNITPNTFPQPGRQSGFLLTAANFQQPFSDLGDLVCSYAVKDGLVFVGRSFEDLFVFKSRKQATDPQPQSQGGLGAGGLGGHFVALMVSTAAEANWPGDYHWARCDNSSGACDNWSQKDGSDQVTNFDFAGIPISNPMTANWQVNQGPISSTDSRELLVEYGFYCFMFVPETGVKII